MDTFCATFRKHAIDEKLAKGDSVRIIGKDEYKGWLGSVIGVEEISGDCIFTIELQANSRRIERFGASLRKEFDVATAITTVINSKDKRHKG